jgi:hypothetical protein
VSGLANAWQYFTLLALASTKATGLVALVIPYEWVSRPSAKALRDYIADNGWDVAAYRLRDETFHRVLTTSSIAIIDKRGTGGKWQYFEETVDGDYRPLASPTGNREGVLQYSRRKSGREVFAKRGLSPGTQEVLTLTEEERMRSGLKIGVDVVPCITSLRNVHPTCATLTDEVFRRNFREAGMKCWLLRTDREPSERLRAYLRSIPASKRQTRTCTERAQWWRFTMPVPASVIVASGFRHVRPKAVRNVVSAVAVGSVSGIYGLSDRDSRQIVRAIRSADLGAGIVTHSNGLRKLEIGQLETFLARALPKHSPMLD